MARFLKSRQKAHGQSPGSLIFMGRQKLDEMLIRQMTYGSSFINEEVRNSIAELSLTDDLIDWINIDGLHDVKGIEALGKRFDINPMYLEDVLNTDQRPKMEENDQHIFISMKFLSFDPEENKLHADQVSFIMGHNYLITFQEKTGRYFEAVRERIRIGKGRIRSMQCDYLLYALMDAISDKYLETIELLGQKIEALDAEIFENPDSKLIESIYNFKTELNYLRKTIRPIKEITNDIVRSESKLFRKKTFAFFKDLDDLITQSAEALEIYYTINSDQLNILNTLIGNKTNDVMKVLTIFAAIFIPLTFVAGIYGTNFDYVPELHFKYSYFIMWGVMIIVAIIMLLYFRRKRWL